MSPWKSFKLAQCKKFAKQKKAGEKQSDNNNLYTPNWRRTLALYNFFAHIWPVVFHNSLAHFSRSLLMALPEVVEPKIKNQSALNKEKFFEEHPVVGQMILAIC